MGGGGGAGGLAKLAEPENADEPVLFSVSVTLVGVGVRRWEGLASPMVPNRYRLIEVDTVGIIERKDVVTLARSNV